MYVYAKNICKYTKFCTVLSKLEKRSWSACASSIGVIFCDSSVNAQMSSCSTCVCVCVCVCVWYVCVHNNFLRQLIERADIKLQRPCLHTCIYICVNIALSASSFATTQ